MPPLCKITTAIIAVLFGLYFSFLVRNGPVATLYGSVFLAEPVIKGATTQQFKPVLDVFTENFKNDLEAGAQLTVYHKGEKVVDLWGKNPVAVPNYSNQTLQRVFSSGKMTECLLVIMCVDQGLFDWDEPIAKYWPEFGQNGKEKITISELMRHESGLFQLHKPVTIDVVLAYSQGNPEPLSSIIEQSNPEWPISTRRVYHAKTRGWIIAELIRRVDPKHRLIHQIVTDEITKPLNLDFYFGVPENKLGEVVPLLPTPMSWLLANIIVPYFLESAGISFLPPVDEEMKKLLELSMGGSEAYINRGVDAFSLTGADLGNPVSWNTAYNVTLGTSFGGIATGSALGSVASIFANKGLHAQSGKRFFSEQTWKSASVCLEEVSDAALGLTASFSLAGFSCNVYGEGWYGWGGWGGSMLLWREAIDGKGGLAVGYAMNRMGVQFTKDPRNVKILSAIEKIVEAN